jgi:hypothetical protein
MATWVRPTDADDLAGHHLRRADGGQHDLEDARGLLLDDGAGDVHAIEHDDHVHQEEEDGDTDFGGLMVLVAREASGDDLNRLQHGVGVGRDDAAMGELLAQQHGAERSGQDAPDGVLIARPGSKGKRRARARCPCRCDPEVAIQVARLKLLIDDGPRVGADVHGIHDQARVADDARLGPPHQGLQLALEVEGKLGVGGDDGDARVGLRT